MLERARQYRHKNYDIIPQKNIQNIVSENVKIGGKITIDLN